MECLGCGNCKENEMTYYCIMEDKLLINENYVSQEKAEHIVWKKGTKEYEKTRKLFRDVPVKKENR